MPPIQTDAPVLRHMQVGPDRYRLSLYAPEIAGSAFPGQFVQILYDNSQPFGMRRPFSVLDASVDDGSFDILYVTRGRFTRGLARVAEGDSVSVVGPLGNGFVLHPSARLHILVAGGVGAPPLYFFAGRMAASAPEADLVVINGARSADELVLNDDFRRLGLSVRNTTDDGSAGQQGTVLAELSPLIEQRRGAAVYACGPEPMLKAVGALCCRMGAPCRLSLETVMLCGVGVCMGCVVKVRAPRNPEGFAYERACKDGPVFDAEVILWD